MVAPTKECVSVGSDAIDASVAGFTWSPKPTANIVTPASLSEFAEAIAAAFPPWVALCCPSVKRKTSGR